MAARFLIFFLINFGGLALGGFLQQNGVSSDWYLNMNRAPWTPPGWVFGAAWTTIMICFSIYMALLWDQFEEKRSILFVFVPALLLNIAWNPIFFALRQVTLGLIVLIALTLVIAYFFFKYWPILKSKSLLLAPYLIWLLIANSLNAYVLFNN